MNHDEFAASIEQIRLRLYRTALLYLGSESAAMDVLDETVYKALKNIRKLYLEALRNSCAEKLPNTAYKSPCWEKAAGC